jgi:hypothetical protein
MKTALRGVFNNKTGDDAALGRQRRMLFDNGLDGRV